MSEVSKRRRLPRYLSLPLIVATLLLVAAKLVALERADLIARLSDQVAHGDVLTSTAALRQLAAMPHPPIAMLVEASTSPNAEIAAEAQAAIGAVLRRMQRNITAGRQTDATASQLAVLGESLVKHRDAFAEADRMWLGKTARRIIRMANRLPANSTPLLAGHCDTILASLRAADVATTGFVATGARAEAAPTMAQVIVSPKPATLTTEDDLDSSSDERFAALADRPFPAAASVAPDASESRSLDVMTTTPATDRSSNEVQTRPAFDEGPSTWQPKWTHPMFFTVPAMPIDALPLPPEVDAEGGNALRPRSSSPPSPSSGEGSGDDDIADTLMNAETRELLARWMVADRKDVFSLAEELTARGFGGLSERLVEQFFSDNVEDRLALVDDVLTEPGIHARPWLLLLADDESAEVRLVAVTIMATSNDPELLEKAWEVAIHDRDPRIADLVPRLRERRAAIESY